MKTKQIILACALTAFTGISMAETYRFADFSPPRGTRTTGMKWWAEELEKRTNGEMKIEFHWSGSLLKAKAILQGISTNATDMGSVVGAYSAKKMQLYSIADLPSENGDPWVAMRAMYDLVRDNKELKADFAKKNLVNILSFSTGPTNFYCNGQKISNIEDLKGVKIRAFGVFNKILKDLGASATSIPASKTYQAIDSKQLNCSLFYPYAIKAYKLHEVVDNATVANIGMVSAFGVFMNKKAYDKLSQKNKDIIDQLGLEFVDYLGVNLAKDNKQVSEDLETGKLGNFTVTKFTPAQRKQLLANGQKYIDEWIEKANKSGVNGTEMYSQYQSLIKKYQKESPNN